VKKLLAATAILAIAVGVSLAIVGIFVGSQKVKVTVQNTTDERVFLVLNAPLQTDGIYVAPGATETFEKPKDKDLSVGLSDADTYRGIGDTRRFLASELPDGDFTIRVSGPPVAVSFIE
jgi:hypothetical protein